jgi:pimeloyl-ACP methyl ester carboxylesterase
MPTATGNGTKLYYETRGNGPPVLFIQGATGDGGWFDCITDLLADEFTTVTNDRRGNSRSPAPVGWMQTSIEEQAEDAAGLLTVLGLKLATVFGTSGGGVIGLELVRRNPELVAGAVLHEPYLPHVLGEQWAQVEAQNRATFEPIPRSGGPRALMEGFLRAMRGEAGYQALDEELRERVLGNGQAFLIEDAAYPRYRPDAPDIAAIRRPISVLVGESSAPWAPLMAAWLAGVLGTAVESVPGGHGGYLDDPMEFAVALRPHLRRVGSPVATPGLHVGR